MNSLTSDSCVRESPYSVVIAAAKSHHVLLHIDDTLIVLAPSSSYINSDFGFKLSPLWSRSSGVGGRFTQRRSESFSEEELNEALGTQSAARLREFQELEPGWSFGRGNAVTPGSLRAMEKFLRIHSRTLNELYETPLVYLDELGSIELLWRGADGHEVFIKFLGETIEYLISPGNEEGSMDLSEIAFLRFEPTVEV